MRTSTARGTRTPHRVDVVLPTALCPHGAVPAPAIAATVARLLDHFLLEHGLAAPAPAPTPTRSAELRAHAAARLQHACTTHAGAVQRVLFLAGAARTRPLAALLVDLRGVPVAAPAGTAGTAAGAHGDQLARHTLLTLYRSGDGAAATRELPGRTRVHVLVATAAAVSGQMAADGWHALAGSGYDADADAGAGAVPELPFTACREAPLIVRMQTPQPQPPPPPQDVFICCDDGGLVSTSGSSIFQQQEEPQQQQEQEQEQRCIWWEVPEVLRGG